MNRNYIKKSKLLDNSIIYDKKNVKVSFNLCGNDQILSWGYHLQNNCENKYEFYYIMDDNYDLDVTALENYKGQDYWSDFENMVILNTKNPNSCDTCTCDSTLYFPEINLCSKLTIVLLTQDYIEIGYNNEYLPGYQYPPDIASKIPPGTSTCNFELSNRSVYYVWKAVLNGPIQCSQKVEFNIVAEILAWDLNDEQQLYYNGSDYLWSDVGRLETFIYKFLD